MLRIYLFFWGGGGLLYLLRKLRIVKIVSVYSVKLLQS